MAKGPTPHHCWGGGTNAPRPGRRHPPAPLPASRLFPESLGTFRSPSARSGPPRMRRFRGSLAELGWVGPFPPRPRLPILSETVRPFPPAGRPFCGADVISGPPYKKAGAGGARRLWRRARSRRGRAAHRPGEAAGGRGAALAAGAAPAFMRPRSGR